MTSMTRAALIAAFLFASATPAIPQSANVPANKTSEVGFVWAVDLRTCGHLARPKIRTTAPRHGKVTTKWVSRKLETGSGRARKCNGRMGKGTAVYYTPERGYRGPDGFQVRVTNRLDGRTRTRTDRVAFTVR